MRFFVLCLMSHLTLALGQVNLAPVAAHQVKLPGDAVADPGERGEEVVRRLSIQGNRLTLLAKAHEMGEDHERRFLWKRLPPSPVM